MSAAVETPKTPLNAYVGFDTITQQIERKLLKRGFAFNVMLVGSTGLGKSTLLNTLFASHLVDSKGRTEASTPFRQTTEVIPVTHMIEENGVKLKLTVVDTPGYGDLINNEHCLDPILKHIKDQYAHYLRKELTANRERFISDGRIHCVLFFISPSGHSLKPLDIFALKTLSEICNVVPVIAKSDSLTMEERNAFKARIREEIEFHGIRVYPPEADMLDEDDKQDKAFNAVIKSLIPFAVVGCERAITVDGKVVRGRRTKWGGIINVENEQHCEFVQLRNFLTRTHLQDLIETTAMHYEAFRTRQLLALKENRENQSPANARQESLMRNGLARPVPPPSIKHKDARRKSNPSAARQRLPPVPNAAVSPYLPMLPAMSMYAMPAIAPQFAVLPPLAMTGQHPNAAYFQYPQDMFAPWQPSSVSYSKQESPSDALIRQELQSVRYELELQRYSAMLIQRAWRRYYKRKMAQGRRKMVRRRQQQAKLPPPPPDKIVEIKVVTGETRKAVADELLLECVCEHARRIINNAVSEHILKDVGGHRAAVAYQVIAEGLAPFSPSSTSSTAIAKDLRGYTSGATSRLEEYRQKIIRAGQHVSNQGVVAWYLQAIIECALKDARCYAWAQENLLAPLISEIVGDTCAAWSKLCNVPIYEDDNTRRVEQIIEQVQELLLVQAKVDNVVDQMLPDMKRLEEQDRANDLQDPSERGRKDLWTLIREDKEREKNAAASGNAPVPSGASEELSGYESVMLVAGASGGGKSTLVHRFLERNDAPQASIGLEYTFGRRTKGVTSVKDLSHIWELAGGTKLLELLEIPVTEPFIHALTMFAIADLSEPSTILDVLKPTVDKYAACVNALLDSLEKRGSRRPKAMRAHALKRYGAEHPDKYGMTPGRPKPNLLARDQKKLISRALRLLAHQYGASLLFTSTKEETLMLRAKQVFTHHAFKTNCPKGFVTDHSKALFILAGSDTFDLINSAHARTGDAAPVGMGGRGVQTMFDSLAAELAAQFPSKAPAASATASGPDLSKYPEPEIEKIKARKDDELERYRANIQQKAKEAKAAQASEAKATSKRSKAAA
ncbi:cell division control protein [Sorochytrium milnesiophthora]